jgi:hypothetical protein
MVTTVGDILIQLGLRLLAAAVALTGFCVFAQGQARVDVPSGVSSSLPDNWPTLLAGFFAMIGGIGNAWINSDAREAKRRAEAEKQRADKAEAERDAIEKERDRLLRYAYKHGYESSEDIPVRKDPP